jgi:hypothetical protein
MGEMATAEWQCRYGWGCADTVQVHNLGTRGEVRLSVDARFMFLESVLVKSEEECLILRGLYDVQ